jgi:ornithine cyclodeaminase/alanine dehydrogenase-like protein (mu-crystallin family)
MRLKCDLVVTATASASPVFNNDWLDPGTQVSGIGANTPGKRELDPATCKVVVHFKEQALQEAGDLQRRCGQARFAPR